MYPYFELTNLVMVYLLGATIAALRLGRGPASFTAIANVVAFDFCFVPPRFHFAVTDLQYVVTFGVMLTVALIIATWSRTCEHKPASPARASAARRCSMR